MAYPWMKGLRLSKNSFYTINLEYPYIVSASARQRARPRWRCLSTGSARRAARALLVDTKYEFGVDAGGRILLVDEIHTPDSSRHAGGMPYRIACLAAHLAALKPSHVLACV